MYKYVFIVATLYVHNLSGQIFENISYFGKCKETYKLKGDTCNQYEMKSFIYENVLGTIPEKDFIDKKNLKLNLRIDSTSYITSCFLTWKDGKKYNLSDVQIERKKIDDFNADKEIIVHYSIDNHQNISSNTLIYNYSGEIFKVVGQMPLLDFCDFGFLKIDDCALEKLFEAINKNMQSTAEINTGKVVFGMIIQNDGYIGDIQIYKNMAGENADKLLLEALNKLKNQKLRFTPGFHVNKPVDVLLTITYDFDASKK